MKHRIRLITTLLLLAALMSSLVGCSPEDTQAAPGDTRPGAESRSPLAGAEGAVEELTAGTTGPAAETERMDRASADAYNNYAFRLFRKTLSRENGTMMVSPYSLWFALGLLVNGANGETRTEIENMLGISTEQMNRIAAGFLKQEDEAEEKVFSTADSIWLAENFAQAVKETYLRTCATYYRASVFRADFENPKTVDVLNRWISDKTKGMIPKMNDRLDADLAMVLVNAVAFDAKWAKLFEKDAVVSEPFAHENGQTEEKKQMYGEADFYLENELCTGLWKDYQGGRYSYIGLLPKDNFTVSELADSLSAGSYRDLLEKKRTGNVLVSIPEYKEEYKVSLTEILATMGMNRAFGGGDFSGIAEESLYVSEVLQKTFIEVNPEGTKAAAATEILMKNESVIDEDDTYRVYLNRSFVYMIIDNITGCPIFIGTVR